MAIKVAGPTRAVLSTLGGVVATIIGQVSWADTYYCKPIPTRIVEAEAIVIQRTVSTKQRDGRLGHFTTEFHNQIEDVLKGDQYSVGDIVVTLGKPQRQARQVRPPKSGWQASVVFMETRPNGELRPTHCPIPLKHADLADLRHFIAIDSSPQNYLDSTATNEIRMVHSWIRTNYFVRGTRGQEKDGAGESLSMSREDAIEYLARLSAHECETYQAGSIQLLGQFLPEEHRDLLNAILEDSGNDAAKTQAKHALRRMDSRLEAISLIEELRSLRRRWTSARESESESEHNEPVCDDPRYAVVFADLVGNLGRAKRPDLATTFIRELETAVEQLGDEAILIPLLRLASTRSSRAERFSQVFSTDALEEARDRIYDDRDAVTLLAARGDRDVADFMIRLIHQGHRDGARWAATVQDMSLVDDLLEAMNNSDTHASARMAYALGRMRAFDVIDQLPDADAFRWQQKARWFLLGLLNESFDWAGPYRWEVWSARLDQYAEAESWSDEVRIQVGELTELVEVDVTGGLRAPYHRMTFDTPWIPPAALPDMPDFLSSTDQVRAFLQENPNRVAEAVRWGSVADRWNVVKAAARARVLLSPDLVGELLVDGSRFVRGAARSYLRELEIVPSERELKMWALGGSNDATKEALDYFVKAHRPASAPNVEGVFHRALSLVSGGLFRKIGPTNTVEQACHRIHAPIVEEVLRHGWHLYDGDLFRTIIATHATGCREQLRTYLKGHHIDLRRWSAIALAHLGDDSGRELILSMRELPVTNSNKANGSDARQALNRLRGRD